MLECDLLQGDVSVELYWNHAPKTCRNFAELVNVVVGKGSCEYYHLLVYPICTGT